VIVLAFPGIGKTPYAKKHLNFVDLDFGFLRTSFGVAKEAEFRLIPAYARLIREYTKEGWNVLINEPKVLSLLDGCCDVCVLPRSEAFSAHKLGVDLTTCQHYIQRWAHTAARFDVPVVYTDAPLDLEHLVPNLKSVIREHDEASPTSVFTKEANKAYVYVGSLLTQASPGLRSYHVDK
jgi:hypothetical protein